MQSMPALAGMVAVFVVVGTLCSQASADESMSAKGFMSIQGERFIDGEGREVLLHGMSVVNKSKADHYASWQRSEDFERMHKWGMNCIRLAVIWDGLEPEPGKYDEQYLKQTDERVHWAKKHGLYVFLDMHQDLFSVLFSDGAPTWATLTDGKDKGQQGGVWSDAYFTNPAVQAAFDNFWANKPGPDGVGVQDHFARAWRHLAKRYADEPTVIGYDLFNEPNMGSRSPEAQLTMVSAFARLIHVKQGEKAPGVLEIIEQWSTTQGRSKLMEELEDMTIYKPVLDAIEPIYAEFERTLLMPMYQRVTNAIREVDNRHIVFLETSMASNMGVRSAIEPVLGPDGQRDPFQAYAPHGYDIVVDTPDQPNASSDRIDLIFSRHAETAKRLKMPMLVGEWGAYGDADANILPAAHLVVRQFEKSLCGETYWDYGRNTADCAYREILQRPIPLCVAGTLIGYQSDPESHTFMVAWRESANIKAPTRIFLPEAYHLESSKLVLDPEGKGFQTQPAGGASKAIFIEVLPVGESVERRFSVSSR
jgi:endoglycosylceramidase